MQKIYGNTLVSNIKSNNQVTLFGETCYALGADKINQVKRIQGAGIKYCYGDEVATWNKEVFEMLKSRLDKPYSCFDGTLNPDNARHWFKKDFLDTIEEKGIDAYVQKYTLDDNPMLDPNFVESLKKEYAGTVYYIRYVLGEWANAEGLLFTQLANDPEAFQEEYEDELKEKVFPMTCVGMDIGGTKSNSSLVATGFKKNWTGIVTYDEYILKHAKGSIDTDRLCEVTYIFLKKLLDNGHNVKYLFIDNAEQIIINTIQKYIIGKGLPVEVTECKKYEGSTRILLYNLMLNTGKMKFYKVPKVVEALSTAMYDEKAKEDKILDDFSTDIDTFDAHFYSFSAFLKYFDNRSDRK